MELIYPSDIRGSVGTHARTVSSHTPQEKVRPGAAVPNSVHTIEFTPFCVVTVQMVVNLRGWTELWPGDHA